MASVKNASVLTGEGTIGQIEKRTKREVNAIAKPTLAKIGCIAVATSKPILTK